MSEQGERVTPAELFERIGRLEVGLTKARVMAEVHKVEVGRLRRLLEAHGIDPDPVPVQVQDRCGSPPEDGEDREGEGEDWYARNAKNAGSARGKT